MGHRPIGMVMFYILKKCPIYNKIRSFNILFARTHDISIFYPREFSPEIFTLCDIKVYILSKFFTKREKFRFKMYLSV